MASPAQDPIREGLAALSLFFVGDRSVDQTLQRLVDLSVEAIDRAEFAGLTMLVDGEPQTPVFSDPASPDIDSAQYAAGSGPCLDAFRHGVAFRVEDTETDTRWAAFSTAAAQHGVHSTLSLPLIANQETLGALNMYARQPGRFSDEDERLGTMFTTQAAIVLANAQAYWDARAQGEDLARAMEHRAVIEQAKGILIGATPGTTPEDAFNMLVRASQTENRKLREVAADIVERRINQRTIEPCPETGPQDEAR